MTETEVVQARAGALVFGRTEVHRSMPGTVGDTPHQRIAKRLTEGAHDVIASARRRLMHDPTPELVHTCHALFTKCRQGIARIRALAG